MPLFRRGNTLGLQTEPPKQEQTSQVLPYATPDQLETMSGTIRQEVTGLIGNAMAEIRGAFQGLTMGRPQEQQQPQLPHFDDISDDEYQQGLSVGDVSVIKKREHANAQRMAYAAAQEINKARAELTPIVDNMSSELAGTILGSLPYYKLLQKDVDDLLKTIPATQRNRSVIEHIYHSVCGRPENLTKIREHEAQRSHQLETERAMASDGPTRRGRSQERDESFESVFGETITSPTATLQGGGPIWQGRRNGYDPDAFARDQGFKDKQEYTRFSKTVMAIEDCPLCLSPVIGGKCAAYCKANKIRSS